MSRAGQVSVAGRSSGAGPMPAAAPTVVVGTAGHIDHSKTSLLRALTGIDADRLPEEQSRTWCREAGSRQ